MGICCSWDPASGTEIGAPLAEDYGVRRRHGVVEVIAQCRVGLTRRLVKCSDLACGGGRTGGEVCGVRIADR